MRLIPLSALLAAFLAALTGYETARAADLTEPSALALMQKHCGACHSRNATHPVFSPAPKNIVFDTMADVRKFAAQASEQLEEGTMPLGNEADMTDDERGALVRWLKATK